MLYRVVLLSNGKYKKTIHKARTLETVFSHYHRLIDENKKVLFPKRFVNSNKIIPVKYQIAVTKPTEDDDKFRILRDDYGKLYTEEPLGEWTILATAEYEIEETFMIYGMSYKNGQRPTIKEVVKKLMVNAFSKKNVKQIIVVYNKLLIYNEEQFDMVICKNMEDAQRLHHSLAKIARKNKMKSLLFMGTATQSNIGRLYDVIHEETGWSYGKIIRQSTLH
jgi:alpha-amylase/alpha-mannosidase (GH57 family)